MNYLLSWPVRLILLTAVTYLTTLGSGFKIDDFTYLNPALLPPAGSLSEIFLTTSNQHYNPLNILLNLSLFKVLGDNSVLHRFVNLAFFSLNIVLLYQIGLRLFMRPRNAAFAAALFSVHPINAEIMNQIVFNTVLVAAALCQASLLLFDNHHQSRQKRFYFGALLSAVTAFLLLETAWILPAIVFLWFWRYRRAGLWEAVKLSFPIWISVLVLFFLWAQMTHDHSLGSDFSSKFKTLGLTPLIFLDSLSYLIFWYLSKLVIPIDHIWIYATQPLQANGKFLSAFLLCLFLLFFIVRRVERPIEWMLMLFLSGFVFLPLGIMAHPSVGLVIEPYWFYFNSMGFFLLIGQVCPQICFEGTRSRAFVIVIGLLIGMFFLTQRFNFIARNEKSYSEYWMAISPNPAPLTALAKIAYAQKNLEKTRYYYEKYLRLFAASPYSYYTQADVRVSLGALSWEMGDLSAAKSYLRGALDSAKNKEVSHYYLGLTFATEGDLEEAERHYRAVLEINPFHEITMVNLADIYILLEQPRDALPYLQQLTTSQIKGNDRQNIYAKLAALLSIYETPDQSQTVIEELLRLDNSPESYHILVEAFKSFGLNEAAQFILDEGLRAFPDHEKLLKMSVSGSRR